MSNRDGQVGGRRIRQGRFVGLAIVLLVGGSVVTVLAVGGRAVLAGQGRTYLSGAMTSRLFLICGLVALGCAAVLAVLGGALWRAAAGRRVCPSDQGGSAMLEFALVLPVALVLVLVMIQSSILMGGNLCVHYAAFCAARSAIVNVPADMSPSEPPNVVIEPASSGKLLRIKSAAVWALMPVSCSDPDAPSRPAAELTEGLDGLFASYGRKTPGWVRAHLGRKLRYAEEHTDVFLAPQEGGEKYARHERLRATVVHTFYLSVPYGNWVFKVLAGDDGVDLDFGRGEGFGHYGLIMRAQCTLGNQGVQDYVDIETFPN